MARERGQEEGDAALEEERRLATSLFNKTWELIDDPDRSAEDDIEMLLAAMTSRWHWGRVGGPEQVAVGNWQVAHVASLLGYGPLALVFAQRSLDVALAKGWGGWRLASAHEGVARACAVCGDEEGLANHLGEAELALADEPDEGDRAVIRSQLATIPRRGDDPA